MVKFNHKIDCSGIMGLTLLILLLLAVFTSCEKTPVVDCFKNTGSIEKSERTVAYFHAIELHDNINLHLIPSSRQSLVLEAGTNLKNRITAEVNEDSVLVIRNNNTCNWVRSYDKEINIYLEFTELNSLEYRSIGHVTNSDTLRLDSLQIDIWEGAGLIELSMNIGICWANLHYGTADILLTGESRITSLYQLGAGKIDTQGLKSRQVYLKNWSPNNMMIWSEQFLFAEIKGLGDVYYLGNPTIESNLIGEGQLIPFDN